MGNHFSRYNQTPSRIPGLKIRYSGSHRPVLENDPTIPHFHRHHCKRGSSHIQRSHLQTSQNPFESDIWPRTSICLIVYGSSIHLVENWRKLIDRLPSTNQQTDWEIQCAGRAISPTVHQSSPKWLGRMVGLGRVHPQSKNCCYRLLSIHA